MTRPLASYDRLRAADFSDEQARAILEALSSDLVTRDHLDVRLEALEHRLVGAFTTRLLQAAGAIILLNGIVTAALDKLAR